MCIKRLKPARESPSPTETITLHEMSSILLDKLEEMGCEAPIYLPDDVCKIYKMQDVVSHLKLQQIDKLEFTPEIHDCDDFAAELFGVFAGLVWTNAHALNWFVDDTRKFWFIEPQTSQIADKLADWQGWKIQFFVGR